MYLDWTNRGWRLFDGAVPETESQDAAAVVTDDLALPPGGVARLVWRDGARVSNHGVIEFPGLTVREFLEVNGAQS